MLQQPQQLQIPSLQHSVENAPQVGVCHLLLPGCIGLCNIVQLVEEHGYRGDKKVEILKHLRRAWKLVIVLGGRLI